ncbi:TonB-dependent receptor [Flagellimonas sp. HMM57]|uniref:TonB-dependent receptor n=1 Tax=unclassified Flagellimonas TaxID=2644544 RepID=UPI0013CF7663|nr:MULTISPECIES: TonB-dependent receptor [unclassified Flagellimonas]UII77921.1 TonB-dependent receptor [Flagellimonas sp. HMM57]
MKKIYLVIFAMLTATMAFSQGVTTSAIGGKITDATGEPLPGASVIAVHTPSGTTYGAAADFDGFYRISGMRTGGPYKITISYVGFNDDVRDNINLGLGQTERFSAQLSESATALDEVVIVAQSNGAFDSGKTGAETNVSSEQVNTLPSISRNIADFARLTPQAKVTGDDVISISGQNNRFNAIYIDGAINNDAFGLAGNGTNGGQTGVSPISLDAIESFQINIAPFDVRQSGFAGGSINATTKSGTNEIIGSAYALFRNENFSGKTPVDLTGDDGEREKLDEFTANTYGVRLGGPIIKDKLFFFVNYERQEVETPQPFDIDTYRGAATESDLLGLSDFLVNNFGYNPGTFENSIESLTSDKLIAKIDWNINESNKLSFRHSYVKAVQFDAAASNQGTINFLNRSINFESITNSSALELNSQIGDNMSNNFVLGYTRVRDDRDPFGNPFPSVQIFDASSTSIFFGSEPFSTANVLDQDIFTITDNFQIYSGRHTITIGTNNEFTSVRNVFFRQNFGDYRFNSLNDFLNGELANRYRHGYSLIGGFGDESEGAAEFDIFQFGLYIQDEVDITDNFRFTLGARIDVPYWKDGLENEDFNTRTVAILEANGKDLQGARVGQGIDANVHFSPRVGFNWDVNGDKTTQIRGGLGIFTSRVPLVWPGGQYTNNGVSTGFIQRTSSDGPVPVFNPDPNTQLQDPPQGSGSVGGQVDLFAKNFKLPQIFKTNIAIDQRLPWDMVFSADFIWNDNVNTVFYENLNLEGPQFTTTGAGSRPNYRFSRVDSTYDAIYLGTNTSAGSSYNITGTLSKNFYSPKIDANTQVSYSYGDSDGLFDGTSSQNSSQWRNLETVNGSNRPDLSTSDFSPGHRIIANSTLTFKWTDNIKTRIGLFYEGAEGTPLSYVYNGSGLLSDTGSFSALVYVPGNESEAQLVDLFDDDDNLVLTANQQWQALDAAIEGDEYLKSRRGQFAERNASRTDWTHIIDLKFAQEFGIKFGENVHKIELTADIFNFTNLLNKEWGVRTFTNFNQVQLLNFEGFADDGTTPEFTFEPGAEDTKNIIDDAGLVSSRWQMQLGIRYSFN